MKESTFRLCVIVGVVFAGGVAYVNTFSGDWVWDDASSVLIHKHVQDPSKFFQLFREDQHAFGRGAGNFYRPLVAASFMLDFVLSYNPQRDAPTSSPYPNVKPLLFHITNLLWHLAAAVLFFILLTRLDAPRFVRAVVPVIYVVHPLHTEAVAYISGRADMMSATFMFAGIWCALWERRRVMGWVLSALCFCAALLSKESSSIFPILLTVVALLPLVHMETKATRKAFLNQRAIPIIAALVMVAAYAMLRMTILRFADAIPPNTPPLTQRLFETGQAFFFYLRKLFAPTHLHMEQILGAVPAWHALAGWCGLLLCVAVLVFALRARHTRLAIAVAWFLATWFPISGLFPLNAPMAEHWMYVPMAGFWWALVEIALLLAPTPNRQRLAGALSYALCLIFVVLAIQRNRDWHDNERLFLATLRENPNSARVHYNLAVAYEDLLGNLPGARRHYEAVLPLYEAQKKALSGGGGTSYLLEDEIDVHLSLGRIALRQGEFAEAIKHFTPLATLKNEKYRPQLSVATMGLAKCCLALGDLPAADAAFRRAVMLDPANVPEVEALLQGKPIR